MSWTAYDNLKRRIRRHVGNLSEEQAAVLSLQFEAESDPTDQMTALLGHDGWWPPEATRYMRHRVVVHGTPHRNRCYQQQLNLLTRAFQPEKDAVIRVLDFDFSFPGASHQWCPAGSRPTPEKVRGQISPLRCDVEMTPAHLHDGSEDTPEVWLVPDPTPSLEPGGNKVRHVYWFAYREEANRFSARFGLESRAYFITHCEIVRAGGTPHA